MKIKLLILFIALAFSCQAQYYGLNRNHDGGGIDITAYTYEGKNYTQPNSDRIAAIQFNPSETYWYFTGNVLDRVWQYSLTGGDISTSSQVDNKSISSYDSSPQGISMSTDGTKLFLIGASTRTIYQFSITGDDITTLTYDSKSFYINEGTDPVGMYITPDGLTLVVSVYSTKTAFQYTLGTAYDISTTTYDNISFSGFDNEANLYHCEFSQDFTQMFVIGNTSDAVKQYTITGGDISTATYDNKSLYVGDNITTPYSLVFSDDLTSVYVGGASGLVFQYEF